MTPRPPLPTSRLGLRLARSAAVGAWLAPALGCAMLAPRSAAPPPAPAKPPVTELGWGEFGKGRIECARGDCADPWLTPAVPGRRLLRVDVYAAVGDDVPAFQVALQDESGERTLRTARPSSRNPRRLSRVVGSGRYRVVIQSVGEDKGPLAYEVVARLEDAPAPRPPATRREPPKPSAGGAPGALPAPTPAPAPERPAPPPPPPGVVLAEVVDVEEPEQEPDGALFVWLDRGQTDGVGAGQTGRVVDESGSRIGRVRVVEVTESGARAELVEGRATFGHVVEILPPGAR